MFDLLDIYFESGGATFQSVKLYCIYSPSGWYLYIHTHTHRMLSALIYAAFRTAVECEQLTSDPEHR